MGLVIDTNAYSAFNRGDARLRKWFVIDQQLIMPLIVLGELRAGFATGNQQQKNELLLQRFLDAPNVVTANIDDNTTHQYAKLFARLRKAGTPIGTNDLWIAAITMELSASLLTLDTDFAYISELPLVKF